MPISRARVFLSAVATLTLAAGLAEGSVPASATPRPTAHQRVLVRLRPGVDAAPIIAEQKRHGAHIRHRFLHTVNGFSADLSAASIAALEADPAVAAISVAHAFHTTDTQSSAPWNLDRIDQRAGGLNGTYGFDTTGAGVTAYVVDTGILTSHTQFGGRATSGYDFVDGDTTATDCEGHGTHVAGTIGGSTYGVAKAVRLVGVRVLDCTGSGWSDDILAGLDWVAANAHRPAVVNMSLGGDSDWFLDDAVARLTSAGISVVVAAGNDDYDACQYSPAEAPSAITVAASDAAGARAWFSNYGSCVDLFAPGVNIRSSTIGSNTATATMSGTSMAAPSVVGAVARYLQGTPGASPAQVTDALLGSATKNAVADPESAKSGLVFVAPSTAHLADDATAVTGYQASSSTAVLKWSPPANTGSAFVSGYVVARDGVDRSGHGPWSTTVSSSTRSVTFTDLVAGRSYALSVKPVTSVGTGNPATVTVPLAASAPFNAPSSVSGAQSAAGAVVVRWQPPTVLAGRVVTGYRVTRSATATTPVWTTTTSATARSITLTGLATSRFEFVVQALTAAGTSPSAKTAVSLAPFVAGPASVVAVQSAAGSGRLTWQPPVTTSGQVVTGYRVYRDGTDSAGRGPWSAVLTSGARSVTFTSLVPGRTYTFSVQAETAATVGAPANVRAAITF